MVKLLGWYPRNTAGVSLLACLHSNYRLNPSMSAHMAAEIAGFASLFLFALFFFLHRRLHRVQIYGRAAVKGASWGPVSVSRAILT